MLCSDSWWRINVLEVLDGYRDVLKLDVGILGDQGTLTSVVFAKLLDIDVDERWLPITFCIWVILTIDGILNFCDWIVFVDDLCFIQGI
jgi:hypothetical protein